MQKGSQLDNEHLKQVGNTDGSNGAESSCSKEVRNVGTNSSGRLATAGTPIMSRVVGLVGQQTSDGSIHERDVGHLYVGIVEGASGEFEYVGKGGICVAAVQTSKIPVELYGVQGGIVSIERVVGGVSEPSGNSTTNEARPYLITLVVIFALIKCDENEGFLHERSVGKGRI